ncbi:hypothetical protein [Salinicola salarius]|uniref:hypothetical protein n=1 Tax=Salinicola salarius TaxID=430457 RepID=UPI0023E35B2E|nr:hypothetical protein [Salinicola salarius]
MLLQLSGSEFAVLGRLGSAKLTYQTPEVFALRGQQLLDRFLIALGVVISASVYVGAGLIDQSLPVIAESFVRFDFALMARRINLDCAHLNAPPSSARRTGRSAG